MVMGALAGARETAFGGEIELRFLAPAPYDRVLLGGFAHGNIGVREIRDIEKQIALPFLGEVGLPNQLGNFITDQFYHVVNMVYQVGNRRPHFVHFGPEIFPPFFPHLRGIAGNVE